MQRLLIFPPSGPIARFRLRHVLLHCAPLEEAPHHFCGITGKINQRWGGGWCHPSSADALFVSPWLHGVLKCGSERRASSTLSDAVDVVDGHVLHEVERAQRIGTVRIESCIIRLVPPPTFLRWERRGGGTSPQGRKGGRGWEIRLIWHIFFCTFNIVSCLGLMYRVHWLILY